MKKQKSKKAETTISEKMLYTGMLSILKCCLPILLHFCKQTKVNLYPVPSIILLHLHNTPLHDSKSNTCYWTYQRQTVGSIHEPPLDCTCHFNIFCVDHNVFFFFETAHWPVTAMPQNFVRVLWPTVFLYVENRFPEKLVVCLKSNQSHLSRTTRKSRRCWPLDFHERKSTYKVPMLSCFVKSQEILWKVKENLKRL